jgi:catechol 2,3-dioxygenase-like lactoylglutathione lyase family enzyme
MSNKSMPPLGTGLAGNAGIMGLHHAAYRCRNSEETRKFYEDFLGLPLVEAIGMERTKTGDGLTFMHTFFQCDDGSCVAFFELPHGDEIGRPFEFKVR